MSFDPVQSLKALHPNREPFQIVAAILTFNLAHPSGPTTQAIRLDLANLWLEGRLQHPPKAYP